VSEGKWQRGGKGRGVRGCPRGAGEGCGLSNIALCRVAGLLCITGCRGTVLLLLRGPCASPVSKLLVLWFLRSLAHNLPACLHHGLCYTSCKNSAKLCRAVPRHALPCLSTPTRQANLNHMCCAVTVLLLLTAEDRQQLFQLLSGQQQLPSQSLTLTSSSSSAAARKAWEEAGQKLTATWSTSGQWFGIWGWGSR
jgi:hypothetical protein